MPQALRDLDAIRRFIARDDPAGACRWIAKLQERARAVLPVPRSGRVVPEVGRTDVREVFVGNYRIVYRLVVEELHILTVFEGHRRLPPDSGGE